VRPMEHTVAASMRPSVGAANYVARNSFQIWGRGVRLEASLREGKPMDIQTISFAPHGFSLYRRSAVALSLGLVLVALGGCKSQSAAPASAETGSSLDLQVQSRLTGDPNLSGQAIQASVDDGIVTLSGNVTSDTVRTIASGDVAQIPGVKTVVNDLVVMAPPASTAVATPSPALGRAENVRPEKQKKPSPAVEPTPPPAPITQPPAPIVRSEPPPAPVAPPPAPPPAPVVLATPPPPPPPAAPVVHTITLIAGTDIPVRITQTLDSATTQTGDKFTGALAADLLLDGMVVLPQGTPVTGHVDAAQDATHFKGSSLLTISLNAINRKGEHIEVATEEYTKQGEGRGKNTAEKVGGGAAVGAILGAIIGGGRGAAIGSAAGAGVGAGAQGVTRGQQVQIPSETVVRFKLSDPVIVHVTTPAANPGNSGAELEHHSSQ